MTNLLIRLFVKDNENLNNPEVRQSYGKLSGWVGIISNIILFIIKFFAGVISKSIAITADALNNLSDASSSVVSLIGFKLSSKSADDEHPYGHARYEYLSALLVAVMIIFIGFELLKTSIIKIISPTKVDFGMTAVIILVVSVLIKLWMAVFNRKVGKKINSKTLIATAQDSTNDCVATVAVLISGLISYFFDINLDGFMGLLVAVFILVSGIGLIKATISPLLGKAPDAELVQYIKQTILSYPGVLGTHDLMVHDYGPGRQFASVHVEMAAEADALESHDVIDNIERDFLRNINLHMIVHLDPIVTSDECVNDFRHWLMENIKRIDERLSIHDLRMVQGTTHTNVIFDCVLPHGFNTQIKELRQEITDMVKEQYPDYYCVITFDSDFAPKIK